MTKHIYKLSARIVVAVIVGLILASSLTTIEKPCTSAPSGESIEKCVSFPDAISHPSALLSNEQQSLERFLKTFGQASIASFALTSTYAWHKNRKQD